MKNIMTFKAISNMVCTIALVLPLHIGTGVLVPNLDTNTKTDTIAVLDDSTKEEPVLTKTNVVLLDLNGEYCDTLCYLTQNIETIEFFSKTFGIDKDIIINDLVARNSTEKYIENNIGRLTDDNGNLKSYSSFEKGLVEYLFDYAKNNPSAVDDTRVQYNGGADYVVNLIKYYTSIYDNVDYLTAVSIGAAESGYYQVKYMLNSNNIYGGMSSSGLIKYKNIEYGVLSYIRLLSTNYYGRGLNTKEAIGYVYCPTVNENGVKTASPHWLGLVSKAMDYYKNTDTEVTVSMLLND